MRSGGRGGGGLSLADVVAALRLRWAPLQTHRVPLTTLTRESASDQDLENRFTAISIAFKTDKLTLEERVAVQKRWRDQAELNMIQEENNLRAAIQKLSHLCKDSTSIEIVTRVKEQVDVLRMAVDWVARSSESLGAIQQESRVSRAVDTVLQYVENLRRLHGRHDDDAKKRSKAQGEESADGEECAGRTVRLRSLQALPGLAKAGSRRRASIAAIPRAAGGYPEGPRAAAVAASPLCTEGRSPRSGSLPRRTSLAPSSPSTTAGSWGSTDHLDAFENAASALMDNIEEISESRRESCSSRLALEDAPQEGNNNNNHNSVKQPCCDGGDGAATRDTEPVKNAPTVKQMYLNYERCVAAVEAARLSALDLLEAETLSLAVRRVAAALLVAAALCYLLAAFFQGAEATPAQGARR